jgi:hypothetical protein
MSQSFKTLQHRPPVISQHWVGDGFPVRTLLAYGTGTDLMQSPFLLLDYAGPHSFAPTERKLGVGEHPHRGFETVTIVYSGEVTHRDSSGAGGTIGAGDVQWMTAGSGVVHEEFHSRNFAQQGGVFEVVQLWVNLPAKAKMTAPRYQALTADTIPTVSLANAQGTVRVIAGEFQGAHGAALTHTWMQVWDVRLTQSADWLVQVPAGDSLMVLVLDGEVQVDEQSILRSAQTGIFSLAGKQVRLRSLSASKLLILSGQPINEPIVGHGPFVMNTTAEIQQAFQDYRQGKMGKLA